MSLLCLHSCDIRSGWCLSKVVHGVKVQLGWPIHQQRSHSSLGTAPAGDAQSIRIISTTNFNLLTWFPYYPPVPPFCRLFEVKLAVAYIQTTLVSARSKGLKVNRKRGYSLITYHISISDTHSSPIIYLYTSIDLTFGLLNVEGFLHSPAIAMLQPFSKHPLKAVRMINNNLQREGLFWLKLRSWNTGLRPKAAQVHVDLFTTCWH